MKFARRQFVPFALAAILTLAGFSVNAQAPEKSAEKPAPKVLSKNAIETAAIDLPGLTALLKRENQRPLLVNFWATWCDPCRDEFPDLVKIDADYRAKGLDFIAISLDDLSDINTEVPKFLREMHAEMPSYLLNISDPEPAIRLVDPKWAGALPATFLYNQQGEVVFKHFGRIKPEELRAAIEKAVGSMQKAAGSENQKAEGRKQ